MYLLYLVLGVCSAGEQEATRPSNVYLRITHAITTVCVVHTPFAFRKFRTVTAFTASIARLRKKKTNGNNTKTSQ